MEGNNLKPNSCLNLVLLGKTGAGKSSSGNTILRQKAFESKKSSKSVTRDVAVKSGSVDGIPVTVYDTPGFCDRKMSEEEILQKHENVLQKCESGLCVFLLVIKADRFTEESQKTVEKIEKLLGQNRLEKTWILFTRGDELDEENMTITEFIEENEELKQLVQKYDQRYHVFNNKERGETEQVRMLLAKILKKTEGEKLTKRIPVIEDRAPDEPITPVSRRIVLLGKTGVGKSAVGNTILGQKEFQSEMNMSSVTSECSMKQATVSGRSVSVVDTPGFFDTQMKPEDLMTEIARCVYLSSLGAHAFLIVFPVNMRFNYQEQQIPQIIEMMFGQEVLKYSIILFTHGDQLEKPVEQLINENCALRALVQQCGGRYQVFNNKDKRNRAQVNELLQKIDSVVEQNGGGHYSNKMLMDALRFRQEENERMLREEEERLREEEERLREEEERLREEEEIRWRNEMARARRETEERIRAEYQDQTRTGNKQVQQQTQFEKSVKGEKVKFKVLNTLKEKLKSGFSNFVSKYGPYFTIACFAISGAVVGGVTGAVAMGALGGCTGGVVGGILGCIGGAVAGAVVGAAGGAIAGATAVVELCKDTAGTAGVAHPLFPYIHTKQNQQLDSLAEFPLSGLERASQCVPLPVEFPLSLSGPDRTMSGLSQDQKPNSGSPM